MLDGDSFEVKKRRFKSRRAFVTRLLSSVAVCTLGLRASDGLGATASASWLQPLSSIWNNPAAWSSNPFFPNNGNPSGSNYEVAIGAAGGSYTVTLNTTVTISSLSLNSPGATLSIPSNQTLSVSTLTLDAGTVQISGTGTLANAVIHTANDSMLSFNILARLADVTFASDQRVAQLIDVYHSLALDHASLSLASGSLLMNGSGSNSGVSLNGNGQLIFNGGTLGATPTLDNQSFGSMAIASGIIVSTGGSGGIIQCTSGSGQLYNNGTIRAATAGATLTISSDTVVNNGTLDISAGTMLLAKTATGVPNHWTSPGTINISGGTLVLCGTMAFSGLGPINRSGGTVVFSGLVNNAGQTLDLDNTPFGVLEMGNPQIYGGTFLASSGRTLPVHSSLLLNNATLGNNLTVDPGGSITLNGTSYLNNVSISLGAGALFDPISTGTLSGSAQIIFDGDGAQVWGNPNTLPSTYVVRTGAGGGSVGLLNFGTLTNNGLISAQTPGKRLGIYSTINNGTIQAINGATLTLNYPLTNTGVIKAIDSFVEASGSFTPADLGNMTRTNSPLNLLGQLKNAGTFDISSISNFYINGGSINGGTVTSSSNTPLPLAASSSSSLLTVNLNAPVQITGGVTLTTNLSTINQPIDVQPGGKLFFNNSTNNSTITATSATFTIGTGVNNGSITLSAGTFVTSTLNPIPNLTKSPETQTYYSGTRTNTGQTFDAATTAIGSVALGGGARINGGTLISSVGSILAAGSLSTVTLDGVTLASDLSIQTGGILKILDGLTLNNATVTATSASINPDVTATQTIGGTGTIALNNGSLSPNTGSVTIGPQIYVRGSGRIGGTTLTINQGTLLADTGLLGFGGPTTNNGTFLISTAGGFAPFSALLTNNGTLIAQDNARNFVQNFAFGAVLANNGTLLSRGGASLTFFGASTVANLSTGTLIGGSWEVEGTSTLNLAGFLTNAANIRISGPGAVFVNLNGLRKNLGTLTFENGQLFSQLGSFGFTNSGTVNIGALSGLKIKGTFSNTGTINVNGTFVADYITTSPLPSIAVMVKSGYAGGAWNAIGINSSAAASATSGHAMAVGYAEASSLGIVGSGTFGGYTVDDSSVVVRYTLAGDANLDGIVNSADFTALASHFGAPGVWTDGDTNYDGVVNALDFNFLASNFGAPPPSSGLGSLVPEPAMALSFAWLLSVRRRRARCKCDSSHSDPS
jgi:hypothetical protein